MKKAYVLLIFGIWVAILPYLGFPYSFKDIFVTISGFGIIIFSYILHNESRKKDLNDDRTFDNFSENKSFNEEEDSLKK